MPNAVQLRVIAAYAEGDTYFKAGDTLHTDEENAARIMRGAPDCWEVLEGTVRVGGPSLLVNYDDPSSPPVAVESGTAGGPGTPAAPDGEGGPMDLDDMTVVQLQAYASEKGIDLGGATRKLDIVAAIERAEGDPDAVAEDD